MKLSVIPKEFREARYVEDYQRNSDEALKKKDNTHPSRLWDWAYFPGYTQHYDMMSVYSNARKGVQYPSYSLDSIGEREVGHKKVDYRSMGYNIRTLAHKNFRLFLKYGIVDSILLHMIEDKTDDLRTYIKFTDNARLAKGQNISFILYNKLWRYCKDRNKIIGNTVDDKLREKVDGALVADPMLMRKQELMVFKHVVDFDEASLYPNMIITFNICKTTIYGAIYNIKDTITGTELTGGDLNQMLQSLKTSIFDIGTNFFGLPSLEQIMNNIKKEVDYKIHK